MLILILLVFVYALYEYQNIGVTHLKGKDFNESNPTMHKRIVFISDIQYDGPLGFNHHAMKKLTRLVNEANPDYLIIGGDIIHKKQRSYPAFDYISKMKGKKLAILGNHDYYDKQRILKLLHKLEVAVLINKTLSLDGINFIGVDDLREGYPALPDISNGYNILLTHEPDYFQTLNTPFNISLAGHLHGGQITLFGLYAPILPTIYGQKYRSGMVSNGISNIYVSKGLGGSVFGLPLRFFAKPEIVVIDI